MINNSSLVFSFQAIDKTKSAMVGGKGAHLGALSKVAGIHVPEGFCITTEVFARVIKATPGMAGLLDQLSVLQAGDRDQIGELSSKIRTVIEAADIPVDVGDEIIRHLSELDENAAYAVRSSATAEDLPWASFAGQHDTYLNIIGVPAVLQHVCKCWASLFTERAILYRIQHGFDHRSVQLAVVVQQMVFPEVAGILFTADPVTGNRKVMSIDASFGLGEALVAGLVNADLYKVRDGEITDKRISTKKQAIYGVKDGGTKIVAIDPVHQDKQALTDEQILRLARTGRQIAAHFGAPQDIEWCLADDTFYIVQSRPITTLYPVPAAADEGSHVYISVGHQQMMTDPLKPLGLSFFQSIALRPMYDAGGRLFVDVAESLATAGGRHDLMKIIGKSEPLIYDALQTIIERAGFAVPSDDYEEAPDRKDKHALLSAGDAFQNNSAAKMSAFIRQYERSVVALEEAMAEKTGAALLDFVLEDLQQLRQFLFNPKHLGVIMVVINASAWLNEKMYEWLGEKNVGDTLSLSVSNNVTSEMGLALLDVADVIRPYPEVIAYLQQVQEEDFLEGMDKLDGGVESRQAMLSFLDKYGIRCAGEIDITRMRWHEKPTTLIPVILNNVRSFAPNAAIEKFEQGVQLALNKKQELLSRLQQLPDGEQQVKETTEKFNLLRSFLGFREYPKYGKMKRYYVYRKALLRIADGLVQAGVIRDREDIYYLHLKELQDVVHKNELDYSLVDERKAAYELYKKLTPPRVMTSDGEVIAGKYQRAHLPAEAIVGLAVSSGVVEGRARVISDIGEADLEAGDILVTAFTDPSWTPLFVSIKGLVTEVGGLMTHGAVIAREYGLPAVVSVEHATKLIKDGQRIRVNGTDGYVELL